MAEKLGILDQMLWGKWADRSTINRNAESLAAVEGDLGELRKLVARQGEEILRLRAMFMGLAELVQTKTAFSDLELEQAVDAAWAKVSPPVAAPSATATDPYRGTPADSSAAVDVPEAKLLLAKAQDHHFSQRFAEARAIYQQVVDQYGTSKQAVTARQQLANLRKA